MVSEVARRPASSTPSPESQHVISFGKSTPSPKPVTPSNPEAQQQQRKARCNVCMCLGVIAVLLLIDWNASRLNIASIGVGGGARTRNALAARGYSQLPLGGSITTATAQQGSSQCISTNKNDAPTAQCQSFCAPKFKRSHCTVSRLALAFPAALTPAPPSPSHSCDHCC